MGFDFSKYGQQEDNEEKSPKKKLVDRVKPDTGTVTGKGSVEGYQEKWKLEFSKLRHDMETFKEKITDLFKVEGETVLNIWNEIYPVLKKMWKRGVFRGRIDKFNHMILDKISRGDAMFK